MMRTVDRLLARLLGVGDPPTLDHAWEAGGILDEPGISDVDGGHWARRGIRCGRCAEVRQVWRGLDVMSIARGQCPGAIQQ